MRQQDRTVEEVLGQLAFSTHGVVARGQLLAAGITPAELRSRLAKGTLLPEFRGVYRVGHRAPSLEARYLAAVWACGNEAWLHGRAAGHLLGLLRGPAPPPEVAARSERRADGVITHRNRAVRRDERMVWRSIPVTTVPRTLLDLAADLSEQALAVACHEAGVRYETTPAQVDALLVRHPRMPGAATLRAVLLGEVPVSLSALEGRFIELLRTADLPLPQTNIRAGGRRVDCRWPEHRLTVELNSYRYHRSRHAWENDHRRAREAYARRDRFRQYTWRDTFEDPSSMMRELTELLRPELLSSGSS